MIMMAMVWTIARRLGNAGCLDVAAAGGFALLACFYATVSSGDFVRKWLLAGMVTICSLLLATLLRVQIIRTRPQEPRRYLALR
jgi:steroid 5-alpha reductase family enzyme